MTVKTLENCRTNPTNAENAIQVSVVIPMRNERDSLPALIQSLRQQTMPPAEIILVDGGSDDGTALLAGSLTQNDNRFRILEVEEASPGKGRNIGIAAARYKWIALTDAGIRLEPTWLERLVGVVDQDSTVQVVYGNMEPMTNSFFERCASLAYAPLKQQRHNGWIRGPFIASSLIRRDVWNAIGGFPDLRASEDLIFMERIEAHRFKVGWAPTATVWWQLQPSLSRTFKRFVLYSRHNVLAGRQRYWHYGLARMYVASVPFLILGLAHKVWWIAVPVAGALTRVAKSICDRRDGRGILWLLNPAQFLGVGVILVSIDLATFAGWAQALWQRMKTERAQCGIDAERRE